jgi:glycosyltransferase involved in cell wall biosynthesis
MCLYLHNDPQTIEGLKARAERTRLLERASMIYCLSSYIRNRFVDGVERLKERVVVLPNGIAALPAGGPPRQQTILYVGRLIPDKGVEELFDAHRRIAGQLPEWRVSIIGRAPERHRHRYERTLAGLRTIWGARLAVAQSVPHAEVMQAYRRAAITVVPSRWQEPFGRTALEALAAGSAVIASRSGGLPEVVGQAGLLLDAVAPDAIEQAILTLARDPARREALGRAGRERAATHFAIDQLSGRLDAWRDELLAL